MEKREIFKLISKPKLEKVYVSNPNNLDASNMEYIDSYYFFREKDTVKIVFNRKCVFDPIESMELEVSYRVILKIDNELEIADSEIAQRINDDIDYISSDAMARISMMISWASAEILDGPLITPPVFEERNN